MTTVLARLRAQRGFALARAARRVRGSAPYMARRMRAEPPERPVGVKLEVTYACNLRCGFCYTDSPRHTAQRTPELDDSAWAAIAEQAIELGVIEAVVTGGEPLMRRGVTLPLLERLAEAGVGVTLNSNGWFADAATAARMGAIPGLHVHVSVDGARPDVHDRSRGVPGSWRRAVAGIDNLLSAGISVHGVHVVTPENADGVEAFLDEMWALGLPMLRVTPVLPIGAAARAGRWEIDRAALRRAVERFRRRRGGAMRVLLNSGTAGELALRDDLAPASLLVRPDGRVRIDSVHPFWFGHALHDGLAECWERIRSDWRAPEISAWARSLSGPSSLPQAGLVPYLDDELPVGGPAPPAARSETRRAATRAARVLAPVPVRAPEDPAAADAEARAWVRGLALSRRYRAGPVRATAASGPRVVRRTDTGGLVRLNATAARAMDALSGGTPAEAAGRLAADHPGEPRERLEDDVLALARELTRRGVIMPLGASRPVPAPGDSVPDLPGLPAGG